MITEMLLAGALLLAPVATETAPPVVVAKTDPAQTGIKTSAYKGKFFQKKNEEYRKCVAQREGRGQYWGTGSNGLYQGTYQMTKALAIGAAWMMRPELRTMFGKERGETISYILRHRPAHTWNRYYQDMAFWTVLGWRGDGAGAHHWAGGRHSCRLGMASYGGNR